MAEQPTLKGVALKWLRAVDDIREAVWLGLVCRAKGHQWRRWEPVRGALGRREGRRCRRCWTYEWRFTPDA